MNQTAFTSATNTHANEPCSKMNKMCVYICVCVCVCVYFLFCPMICVYIAEDTRSSVHPILETEEEREWDSLLLLHIYSHLISDNFKNYFPSATTISSIERTNERTDGWTNERINKLNPRVHIQKLHKTVIFFRWKKFFASPVCVCVFL